MTKAKLVFHVTVEEMALHRVMRQIGLCQESDIPVIPHLPDHVHKYSRVGGNKSLDSWCRDISPYVDEWTTVPTNIWDEIRPFDWDKFGLYLQRYQHNTRSTSFHQQLLIRSKTRSPAICSQLPLLWGPDTTRSCHFPRDNGSGDATLPTTCINTQTHYPATASQVKPSPTAFRRFSRRLTVHPGRFPAEFWRLLSLLLLEFAVLFSCVFLLCFPPATCLGISLFTTAIFVFHLAPRSIPCLVSSKVEPFKNETVTPDKNLDRGECVGSGGSHCRRSSTSSSIRPSGDVAFWYSVRPSEAMLRNRSRRAGGGGGGGGLMPQPEPLAAAAAAAQSSSSPRPYMALAQAGFLDGAEQGPSSSMSPTSILETKQFCCSALPPFLSERSLRKAHMETASVGGLADVLREHGDGKAGGRKVVFGSQLRIQVPSDRAVELVSSPIEFGVKNRDAQLAVLSPARRFLPEVVSSPSARVFAGGVAPGEMAMSEDYTCVISRGPNPRTMHIFDDCIVESCGDVLVDRVDNGPCTAAAGGDAAPASGFLSSCHSCRRQLAGHANDTFIHGGDKAFCSDECRYREMLFDEAVDNLR